MTITRAIPDVKTTDLDIRAFQEAVKDILEQMLGRTGTKDYMIGYKDLDSLLTYLNDDLIIGTYPSYTHFERDGTMVAHGQASCWDDLRFPVDAVKLGGTFPPTETAYKGGVVLAFDTGPNNENVTFIAQLPHGYIEGSNLTYHIHWVIPVAGAGAGAENVKWDFSYSWANPSESFPAASTATVTIDVQNHSADIMYLDTIVEMNGSGKKVSSVLICDLSRDVAVASDYANDVYFITSDFHFQKNAMGSRKILTK